MSLKGRKCHGSLNSPRDFRSIFCQCSCNIPRECRRLYSHDQYRFFRRSSGMGQACLPCRKEMKKEGKMAVTAMAGFDLDKFRELYDSAPPNNPTGTCNSRLSFQEPYSAVGSSLSRNLSFLYITFGALHLYPVFLLPNFLSLLIRLVNSSISTTSLSPPSFACLSISTPGSSPIPDIPCIFLKCLLQLSSRVKC